MTPQVFPTLSANAAVRAALGASPTRIYPWGLAPDNVADPYCVWQVISGTPNNFLGCRPNMDYFAVQFDVYGVTEPSVVAAAKAIRDALEPRQQISSWGSADRDSATKRYRFNFSVNWWQPRS